MRIDHKNHIKLYKNAFNLFYSVTSLNQNQTEEMKNTKKQFFVSFKGKIVFTLSFTSKSEFTLRIILTQHNVVDEPTFLSLLFPIINVRRR